MKILTRLLLNAAELIMIGPLGLLLRHARTQAGAPSRPLTADEIVMRAMELDAQRGNSGSPTPSLPMPVEQEFNRDGQDKQDLRF